MRSKEMSSFILILLLSVSSLAQTPDKLKTEWLSKDIESIRQLLPRLEQTDPTLESLEKLFGREPELTELGFGASTFAFSKPGGYTSFRVRGLAVNGRIGHYRIAVGCSSSWEKIKNHIIQTWNANSQLAFDENECGIGYYKEYPTVIAEYKEVVRSQLGDLKNVTVPSDLQDAYEELISLGNNSVFGIGGCDYGGRTPRGKTAIDKIVKASREDLIENILKGYNPGGRIYALLALLELQKSGTKLSAETENAMRVVRELELDIETCSGCIHGFKTAQKIISEGP